MVYENDIIEIPEKYKKMSLEELKDEEERLYKILDLNRTRVTKRKLDSCPVKFNL